LTDSNTKQSKEKTLPTTGATIKETLLGASGENSEKPSKKQSK